MIDKLREWFPANRVAALAGFVASIAAALAALQTSFVPGTPPAEAIAKAVAFLGSVAGGLTIVWKFLDGAQNSESLLTVGVPKVKGVTVVQNVATPQAVMEEYEEIESEFVDTEERPTADTAMSERARGFEDEPPRQSLGMDPNRPS